MLLFEEKRETKAANPRCDSPFYFVWCSENLMGVKWKWEESSQDGPRRWVDKKKKERLSQAQKLDKWTDQGNLGKQEKEGRSSGGLISLFMKQRKKERNIYLLSHFFMHSLVNSYRCHDQGLNPQLWRYQDDALTNWSTWPGWVLKAVVIQEIFTCESDDLGLDPGSIAT